MDVLLSDDQAVAAIDLATWSTRLADLLGRVGLPQTAQLSVSFVDDPAIQMLNHEYRGKDRPTDVLSFPQVDYEGLEAAVRELQAEAERSGSLPAVLGDVVVSVETARRQAAEYGHSLEREIGFLLVHGILHLLGEDHETAEDDARMRAYQRDYLAAWGLER